MGLQIESAFNLSIVGPFAFYVNLTEIRVTSGPYTHSDFSGSVTHAHGAVQFASTLQTWIRFYTGDSNYTVAYSAANKQYTIAHPSISFALFFPGDEGHFAKRVLGFTDYSPASTTHTSDTVPWFVIESRWDCPIEWTPDYEQSDVRWGGNYNGIIWGGGPSTIPKRYDMRIGYIPYAELWKREAVSSNPWTWEDFINYHAAGAYFFVHGSTWYNVDHAHKLTSEGTRFSPVEADSGFLREYHLDLKTYIFR